ncbi:hypothetical protein LEP1GSC103_1509 [Leptospira borgpetersenii serovar Javanica str. UI 09931]|nr:hypothetical protein LEP1GSC101_2404 [Leptospira borgpetersenii str. UI 09149]EMN58488.1 hypothetical protein LEP1GSC090_0294 [Leptospira borgpetersenii serovar Javanica str. MK146]ENO61859.1 hypothetical protein LEP1GSC191_1021 [Leptospira borgpetersenii serovar Mini str. 201000851]EPG56480.1 hypothetical protein LEP1GSC103_1509 [Leptospira borgpetersenii serovar Javanica str. UI 09931]
MAFGKGFAIKVWGIFMKNVVVPSIFPKIKIREYYYGYDFK